MKTTYQLKVIQPQISACNENWDNMLPHEKGAFCNSCKKVVHNLENLSADQLAAFLIKNEGVEICGRIKTDHITQPISLVSVKRQPDQSNLLFSLCLFLVFGVTLFSCDEKELTIVQSTIANSFSENILIDRETEIPVVDAPIS